MGFNHKPRERGFTLIELLTVISIIGLLSSIILAGLNSAKKKAQDAVIISDLRNFSSQTELSRTDSGYSAVNDTGVGTLADAMKAGIQKISGATAVSCFSAGDSNVPDYNPSGESNLRWACSATNSDKSILWSVSSESGRVVTWENAYHSSDGNSLSVNCPTGMRPPMIEELYTARYVVGKSDDPIHGAASFDILGGRYWSSTPYVQPANAWVIFIGSGGMNPEDKGHILHVRCVR